NSGAVRTLRSTFSRAVSRISSVESTTTAEIPCITRSVTTPTPMLPAPSTPTSRNCISGPSACRDHAAPSAAVCGCGFLCGRRRARALIAVPGGAAMLLRAELCSHQGHRRALEQAHDREVVAKLALDQGQHLDGLERRATDLEEVVVQADARASKHLSPDA